MPAVNYEVAISGFTSRHHVQELSGLLSRKPEGTRMVFGFSTGYYPEPDTELARRQRLYVPLMESAKLYGGPEVDYLAHFTPNMNCDFSISHQVLLLYSYAGSWLDGVQINNPGVPVSELRRISELDPGKELVFPLGRMSMRRIIHEGYSSYLRLQKLLANGVTTLLLDNSAGVIEPLSYGEISVCMEELWRETDARLRIAGRLGDTRDGLEVVSRLMQDDPEMSFGWESESRLRSPDDMFDVEAAKSYFEKSFELIQQHG